MFDALQTYQKITKTVNKHDKINGSGKKRCTKATQPLVKERNKIDQPPYVYVLQLFEVVSFITFKIENSDILGGIEICSRRVVAPSP